MRRRHAEPQGLEALLRGYLSDKGYLRQSREVLAALLWPQTVGTWYAQHTRVVDIEGGVLTVWCDSAPRAQQLQADAERILEMLNRRVSEQLEAEEAEEAPSPPRYVTEIRASSVGARRGDRFRWSEPSGPAVSPGEAEWRDYPLTAEEEERVEALGAAVELEELRDKFRQALRASLQLQRWRRAQGWKPCPECEHLLPPGEARCLACAPSDPPEQVRE
jgi:predicted nucleic acid-binding Zn ribbon protein